MRFAPASRGYFAFEGDIERHDLTWFDGSGRQVAQRTSTDYPEYCGGKARTRYQGLVAKCGPMKRDELICGTGDYPLPRPIEAVLERTLPIEGLDTSSAPATVDPGRP